MMEQYCIHTTEKIRSRPVIRMTEQQEMFRVLYPIICGTQRVECLVLEILKIFSEGDNLISGSSVFHSDRQSG